MSNQQEPAELGDDPNEGGDGGGRASLSTTVSLEALAVIDGLAVQLGGTRSGIARRLIEESIERLRPLEEIRLTQ